MELIAILLGMVVMLLVYRIWILWKANDSYQPILEHLRGQIRSGLKVVGINELEAVQKNLCRLEQQVRTRLPPVKTSEEFSPRPQKGSQEIDSSFVCVEQPVGSTAAVDLSFPRPRSILWNGLRFTLSDTIWPYLGLISGENIEDDQVQIMVQGPFCRVCLKRLVGRYSVPAAEVPERCRHCGLSWFNQNSDYLPFSLVELKRRVYDNLDRELRAGRRVQR